MMLDVIKARPLVSWPGEFCRHRRHDQFRVKWSRTMEDLLDEVTAMGARDAWLGLAIADRDLRIDGALRANASPAHPGVVLQLLTKQGRTLSFPCDTYFDWQGNVRAISLTLTALRAVERYGVVTRGEQYVGFAELPAGKGQMTTTDAMSMFHKLGWDGQRMTVPLVFREAARRLHPDAGGDVEEFQRLTEARRLIESS